MLTFLLFPAKRRVMSQGKKNIHVNSPHVQYSAEAIVSDYYYDTVQTKVEGDNVTAVHHRTKFTFKTNRNVPKLGYAPRSSFAVRSAKL